MDHGQDGAGSGSRVQESLPRLNGVRVVVVDDNADAVESMAELLRLMGASVRTGRNGLEALASADSFDPHVMLLDLGMPKLDGYEVARRLRAGRNGSGPVLIALTGWGQQEDRHRTREAGFDHHLVKPVDFEALARLLSGVARQAVARG